VADHETVGVAPRFRQRLKHLALPRPPLVDFIDLRSCVVPLEIFADRGAATFRDVLEKE
jgi:hypothetical protein